MRFLFLNSAVEAVRCRTTLLAAVALVLPMLPGCSMQPVGTPNISHSPALIGLAEGCPEAFRQAPHSTFVLYVPSTGKWTACNDSRAAQRYLPASTFKVPHALIALETGSVTDEHQASAWDGRNRKVAAWNTDTSLATGMQNSTVWLYQRTARSIGWRRMAAWVKRLGFGNEAIGSEADLTSFWLTGDLRISAIEQVKFLDALRDGRLPAKSEHQRRVRAMMEVGRKSTAPGGEPSRIFAKSGAVLPIDASTGDILSGVPGQALLSKHHPVAWYVGWVSRAKADGGDAVFAFNLDLSTPEAMSLRQKLAHQLLVRNGALPAR